jgi:polysaccharide export outer membrane protein
MRGGGKRSGSLQHTIAILSLLTLVGCGATRSPSPGDTRITGLMSDADRARLAALAQQRIAAQSDPDQGYRIGPDDLLEITIPDLIDSAPYRDTKGPTTVSPAVASVEPAPSFRQGIRVTALGDVSLPQLGIVPASGQTAPGLAKDIARRLRGAGILNEPEVTVTVIEHRSHVVAVVGSVQRPGLFPLTRPQATIADMIWAAGGPSKEAGRIVQFTPATVMAPSAQVDRVSIAADAPPPASAAPIRIDLELLLRASEAGTVDLNAPVRPGDVISIAPAGIVLVDGWVIKPGSYPVTRNLTLTGTIAAAGGASFAADRGRATLKRMLSPTEEYYMTVDLHAVDDRLQPDLPIIDGDVVYLPASGPRLVPWGLWQFFTNVFRIGASVVAF